MNTKLWKSVVIAGLSAVLTTVFLLVGAIAVSLRADDPEKQIGIWIFPILIVSAAVAGWLARKLYGEKKFIVPLAAGGVYLLLIGAIALPFGGVFSLGGFFLKLALVITTCLLTGISGGNSFRMNGKKAAKRAGKIYKGKR